MIKQLIYKYLLIVNEQILKQIAINRKDFY